MRADVVIILGSFVGSAYVIVASGHNEGNARRLLCDRRAQRHSLSEFNKQADEP